MGFEFLEFLERRQIWVLIAESNDITDVNLIAFNMVDEGTAILIVLQRPTKRMHHGAFFVLGRINFPKFLKAKPKFLRACVL